MYNIDTYYDQYSKLYIIHLIFLPFSFIDYFYLTLFEYVTLSLHKTCLSTLLVKK